jgi:hypothetical protein
LKNKDGGVKNTRAERQLHTYAKVSFPGRATHQVAPTRSLACAGAEEVDFCEKDYLNLFAKNGLILLTRPLRRAKIFSGLQDKPIQDKPIQDKPIQDKPIQDKPIQDKPIRDKPMCVVCGVFVCGKPVLEMGKF